MIYKHFASKQALFAAVLERGSSWIKQRFAEILSHDLDPDRAAERSVTTRWGPGPPC